MGILKVWIEGNTYPVSYTYDNHPRTIQKHFPCASEAELVRFLQDNLRLESDSTNQMLVDLRQHGAAAMPFIIPVACEGYFSDPHRVRP
jgi:hypothetical protein